MVSKIGALARLGGLPRHVKSRFPGIGAGARGAIRPEIKDLILAGDVARPRWQTGAVRVAGLGEVDPVALRHARDRQILWRRRAAAACRQRAEHVGDFAAVRGPGPHLFPHRRLNVGEPVQIDGRSIGGEGVRGKARWLGQWIARLYLYPFSYVQTSMREQLGGAPHGGEMAYVFGTLSAGRGGRPTPKIWRSPRMAQSYWVNFARPATLTAPVCQRGRATSPAKTKYLISAG